MSLSRCVSIVLAVGAAFFATLSAADRYVTTTGSGDGSSWDAASDDLAAVVAASQSGDTVHVGSGTFTVDEDLVVPSGVSLIGRGPSGSQRTVITGSWEKSGGFPPSNSVIRVADASDVLLQDFAVDGQNDRLPGGVYVLDSQRVSVRRVHVLDTNFVGMWLVTSSELEVDDCYLYNCGHENTNYSTGLLSLGGISDSRIHHTRIYGHDDNDGYGIKSMGGGNSLTRVEFDHLDIDVKPRAMWNGGSSNFSMELAHSSFADEVRIHDCTMNMGLSLVGKDEYTGDAYSMEIYHNYLDVVAGRWIELSTNHIHIHHNYFTGAHSGHPTFNNYDPTLDQDDVVIHHNIFEFASRELFGLQGANDVTFCNNTVIWSPHRRADGLLAKLQHDNSAHSWIVKNNLFLGPAGRTGELFATVDEGVAPAVDADRNHAALFTIPGNTAPSGALALPLDGAKPDWWRPGTSSALINAGVHVPGCTDDAVGDPDIGAFEQGGDNRFLPADFTWPVLPARYARVTPGIDYALYDFPDESRSMLEDIREVHAREPDAIGTSDTLDSLLVIGVDPIEDPEEDQPGEYAAAVFTGYIDAPSTGLYRFWLTSEDGSRLQIDGHDVLESDGWHGEQTVSDVVRLAAGLHRIRVYYASWWGAAAAIELRWRPPGEVERAVVATDLFRADPALVERVIGVTLSRPGPWSAAIAGRPMQTASGGETIVFPGLDPAVATTVSFPATAPGGDG